MNEKKWTASQTEAINSEHQNILVTASPGSGKSSVTVARILRQIATGVDPRATIAITFTTAGAKVLQERIGQPLGFAGTIHAFCLRHLKMMGEDWGWGDRTALIDEGSARQLLETKAKTLGCFTKIDELEKLKGKGMPVIGQGAGMARASQLTKDQLVVLAYQEDLRAAGMVDFDTILSEFCRLLEVKEFVRQLRRYTHLCVDEVQDSGPIDWKIFLHLPVLHRFLVGDSDQSIFGFRGAQMQLMLGYSKLSDVHNICLEENFRSDRAICEAAQRLIQRNTQRIAKRTVAVSKEQGLLRLINGVANEGEEIGMVARQLKEELMRTDPNEIAVLARTNRLANSFKQTFQACGIPVAEPKRKWLPKDLPFARAAIELMSNPSNDTLAEFYLVHRNERSGMNILEAKKAAHEQVRQARAASQSVNSAHVKFARQSLPNVPEWLASLRVTRETQMLVTERINGLPAGADLADLLLALGRRDEPEEITDGVWVTTAHASKGTERDCVFIVGAEEETWFAKTPEDMQENRRLFFVAMTRARHRLFISWAASRVMPWGRNEVRQTQRSRFVGEAMA